MALAIQKRMCCKSGRRSVMVKRDRVAGSWLGKHSGCYSCCSSASPLKLLGRKQPAWGNARRAFAPPPTPKPSTPLGRPFARKNLVALALRDSEGDPAGTELAKGHLAFVRCHFSRGGTPPNTAELQ